MYNKRKSMTFSLEGFICSKYKEVRSVELNDSSNINKEKINKPSDTLIILS